MDETVQQIAHYLRGGKLTTRSQDTRAWAEYLDTVIQPQLAELATSKIKKEKGKATA